MMGRKESDYFNELSTSQYANSAIDGNKHDNIGGVNGP